jgi:hypothetical protein
MGHVLVNLVSELVGLELGFSSQESTNSTTHKALVGSGPIRKIGIKQIKGVEEMKFREAFENFITSKYVLGVLVVLTVYQIIQMLK